MSRASIHFVFGVFLVVGCVVMALSLYPIRDGVVRHTGDTIQGKAPVVETDPPAPSASVHDAPESDLEPKAGTANSEASSASEDPEERPAGASSPSGAQPQAAGSGDERPDSPPGARGPVRRVRKGGGDGFIDLPKLVPPTALQKRIAEGIEDEEIVEALRGFETLRTTEKLDLISAAKLSGHAEMAAPLVGIRPKLVGYRGRWDPVLALRYLRACSSLLTSRGWSSPDSKVPGEDRSALARAYLETLGDLVEKSREQLDEAQWYSVYESLGNVSQVLPVLVPAEQRAPHELRVRTAMRDGVEKSLEGHAGLSRGRLWPVRFLGRVATQDEGALFLRLAEARKTLVEAWKLDHGHEAWSRELLLACVEAGARWGDDRARVGLAQEVVVELRGVDDVSVRRRLLAAVASLMKSESRQEIGALLGSVSLSESEQRAVNRPGAANAQGDGR